MSNMLKKLPFLKKKDSNGQSNPQINNNDRRRSDNQEAHFSGSQPPGSSPPQRASQVLPSLVISPAPLEVRKKILSPALVPSDLVQRRTSRTPPRAPQVEIKQDLKEPTHLPRAHERERAQTSNVAQARKRSPDAILPFYPEFSDECFRKLWESKRPLRGRPVKEALDLMGEREILDTLLEHLRPLQEIPADHKLPRSKISGYPSTSQKPAKQQSTSQSLSKDKISLYKYYGMKLMNSRQKDLIKEQLKALLGFSCEEETDREGISETIGMAAFCHLPEILVVLRDVGHFMHARRPSLLEAPSKDSQNLSERQIRTALILCYGQAAMGARSEEMIPLMDHIVSEILVQYSTRNKDEDLKKAFMRSVIMITKAVAHSRRQGVHLPHKPELVINIIEIIEDEPVRSLSVVVLHQAIITITCMTRLKPSLNSEMRSNVAGKSIQKVFSLPALKMTTAKADSPSQSTQTQDFYQQTVTACNAMLTGLVSEDPNLNSLQDILRDTNPWIESYKTHERERALQCTRQLLKFASENVNFDTTADFVLLGQLVALLALHIGDSSKEAGQMSAEAAYHLHHLIMTKMAKEMDTKRKNRKGNIVKWLREDFISGPAIFYDSSKMARAFGEHLTPSQLTDVILKALEAVKNTNKNISQAAGMLLNSLMEECGMEMEELPMILREMYMCLPNILDPATKEDVIKAVCHLASKRPHRVVDTILEVSVECDGTARELWRALVSDPYANLRIMKPLLKRLQDEDPTTETTGRRNSKSIMPIASTNALSFILSLPEATDAIQNKFPQLLIALVTQIYFLLGASKRGSRRPSRILDNSQQVNFLSTAVQAIQNLIMRAGYTEEYNALGLLGCWEMLFIPDSVFEAIFHLVRNLFSFSKVELKAMFRQANIYLRHPDIREKTIGMVFFSELLYHPEVGNYFMMQDILDVLHKWMSQSYLLLQIFSVRGLGYLLQHHLENKILQPLLLPVINCASHPDKSLANEALRTLQFIFRHLDVETYGYQAICLIPHLVKYFPDEDTELRYNSISIFGMLLKGVKEMQNRNVAENIMQGLVPLLIQLSDGRTKEVSRNALNACVAFMEWQEVPSDLFNYEMYSSPHSLYKDICAVIMNKCKQNISQMLDQMLDFLGNKRALYREAAAQLIACCAPYLTPDMVPSRQLEAVYLALRDLEGDCEPLVAQVAAASVEELFRQCGHRINPDLVSSQLLAKVIGSISIQPSETQQ